MRFWVFFKSARLRVLEIMKLNMQLVIKLLQTLPQTLSMSRVSDPVPPPVPSKMVLSHTRNRVIGKIHQISLCSPYGQAS